MADLALIPTNTLTRIRGLLRKDPRHESACLVLSDWSLLELHNTSHKRDMLITPTGPEYDKFVSLLFDDKLFGWAHSHPHWDAWPSHVDLEFHQFPIHMLIYSVCLDKFRLFSPQDLTDLENNPRNIIIKEFRHEQTQ